MEEREEEEEEEREDRAQQLEGRRTQKHIWRELGMLVVFFGWLVGGRAARLSGRREATTKGAEGYTALYW